MAGLPSPDVVAVKAFTKEALPKPPQVIEIKHELASNVAKKANEGDWRGALETARRPAFDRKNAKDRIDEIGSEKDPATGARTRTPHEQMLYADSNAALQRSLNLLDKGYGNLSLAEQGIIQGAFLREVNLIPGLAAEINGMTGQQRNEFFKRMLGDPKYGAEVRKVLERLGDESQKIGDEMTKLQEDVEDVELTKSEKQLEIEDVTRRLDPVEKRLKDFERPPGGTPGKNAQEIDRLRKSQKATETKLAASQSDVDDHQFRLTRLQAESSASQGRGWAGRAMTDIESDIVVVRGQLKAAQIEVAKYETELQKLQILEQEQKQLEDQKAALEKEKREKEAEMKKIELDLKRRQALLENAKTIRLSREEDLADGFKNIFNEASREMIISELQGNLDKAEAEIESMKQESKNEDEKAMLEALQKRWLASSRERGIFRKERYRPINKNQVGRDYNVLLTDGPEALMKQMLTDANGAGYTGDRADEVLKNKEFIEKMQPELVKQLIAKKVLTGGIAQEDVQIIVMSDWGRGMIEQGLALRGEVIKGIEGLKDAGALGGPGFIDRFIKESTKRPWILLALLGLIAMPVVGLAGAGLVGAGAPLAGMGIGAATNTYQEDHGV